MGRPVGVTILAILDFLFAVCLLLGGIGAIMGGGIFASMMSQAQAGSGASGASGIMAFIGGAMAVFCFIFAVISALLGWGLWKLKNWARIITIIFEVIFILLSLLGLLGILAHFNIISLIWTLFWIAIYCLIIWYLLKPDVKAAFK